MSLEEKLKFLQSNISTNFPYGVCIAPNNVKHVSDHTFGHCISFNEGDSKKGSYIKIDGLSLHPLLSKLSDEAGTSYFSQYLFESAKEDFKEQFPILGNSIGQTNGITISFWAKGYTYNEGDQTSTVILFAEPSPADSTDSTLPSDEILSIAFTSNAEPSLNNTTFSLLGSGNSSSINKTTHHPDSTKDWINWAFTVDFTQGVMKIYREGSVVCHEVVCGAENNTLQSASNKINKSASNKINNRFDIFLGANNREDNYYHGKLAHLRVYNRVLSPEEINECMKVDKKTENGEDNPPLNVTPDTTLKPMEYQTYQVKGNPTIKTGYPASKWTAVIAGYNCGAEQQHKATALKIMPVVDDGEWKIKCDIKDADDSYWDVVVLFIRNNVVNRLNNFGVE